MSQERAFRIDRKTTTQDAYGGAAEAWTEVCTGRGEFQDALPSRSESVKQGLAVARDQVRFRMRWRNDINATMRVTVFGDTDTVYQIVGGPAEFGPRKSKLEMVLERYTSQ